MRRGRSTRPHARAVCAIAFVAAAGCTHAPRLAVAGQFARVLHPQLENDAGGLGVYLLSKEEEGVGLFADARYTQSGNAFGPLLRDVPSANLDETTDRQVTGISWHVGPTARVTDWLHVYAGVGVGYWREHLQKADASRTVTADGVYRIRGRGDYDVSGSLGVILMPYENLMVGVGYDTFLEGPVFSLGFVW